MNKTTVGSAYHDIDYTNEIYYTGEVCMGCHSHKKNSHQFDVCTTDDKGAKNKESNCITCHMPKVDGSATTVRLSKQHAFHGFAGAIVKPKMLAKHIDLTLKKLTNGFEITVENKAPHNLMTHPLRVVQLRSVLIRDTKQIPLKTETFVKVIGKNKMPSMPWVADEIVKDTMIQAEEKRTIKFDTQIKSGDKIEVILGYYLVNPQAVGKLNLQDEKELTDFKILKTEYFNIK